MRHLNSLLFPIHPEGFRFIVLFAVIALLLFALSSTAGWIGVALTGFCAFFFRDPDRAVPQREGVLVSPADGKIVQIDEATPPKELGLDKAVRPRVSIHLSLLNCHVNRMPAPGVVKKIAYRPGQFISADLDKASEVNERNSVLFAMDDKRELVVVQIAGLIARRIACFVREEQEMDVGERFGLIRFGSRVDIYLPLGIVPQVALGQTVIGGESVIADLEGAQEEWEALVG